VLKQFGLDVVAWSRKRDPRIQTKFAARQQRTTLTEASPPASDGTL
jgi:hypothetical protein